MQPAIKNDLTYLLRILESINKIHLYSGTYNEVSDFFFANDKKDFNASLMLFINIGEQCEKISETLKQKHPGVPWKKVKDFRNRVAHDYAGIETYVIFDTIKKHLVPLKEQIENIINTELGNKNFNTEEFETAEESQYYKHIDFGFVKG